MKFSNKSLIYILAAVIIIFIIIMAAVLISNLVIDKEYKVVKVYFQVGHSPGFDLDNSILTFGRVVPGGSASRKIYLENLKNIPIKLNVKASKSVVDFLIVDIPDTLGPYEKIEIPVTLSVPANISYGNYSGMLIFELTPIK